MKLLEVMPKGLDKFFFTTSGTEANEAAIKIARMYTGKHKIIARYTSYHGSTAGSVAATGDFRRWFVEPTGRSPASSSGPRSTATAARSSKPHPDVRHRLRRLPRVHDRARGERRGDDHRADRRHQRRARAARRSTCRKLAALAKKHGVLLIADEVMTGWGRTGDWFAVDHWGVRAGHPRHRQGHHQRRCRSA